MNLQLRFLSNLLSVLNRRQREHAFRLSVAETATQNITMRLEYVEDENQMLRAALVELSPIVQTAKEYATPAQLWAIAVARDMARLEKGE
jgi:NADH:ubiquinone oxidoreductase subunit E